ncbi:hypothetical protein TCON_0670 [Astathelohania contejeani]|uniref:Reverse transcriptase n=1 Tax=Astathelohania contejeani TaxID=164912 RepID=A0ABQ7I145_9MICR|nr:hypothetical protein TCON_0670 [Thelohania contejeani]
MVNMVKQTESFFKAMGIEINREKSATNYSQRENTATLLNGTVVYKYLGIIEDHSSNIMRESFKKLRCELLTRVNRLCNLALYSKILFKAINEHLFFLSIFTLDYNNLNLLTS